MRRRWLLVLAVAVGCAESETPPTAPADDIDQIDAVDAGPGVSENFGVTETEGDAACDNLNTAHCVFPFPSDYYRVDGRLEFGETSLPKGVDGKHVDKHAFSHRDGYSPVTPMLFRFEGALLTGTASVLDIASSLLPESLTVILDTETGERVAHWVEHDHFSVDGGMPVFTLRLPQRLAWNRRYIVAVRGLVYADGALVPADPGFAALRDQTASTAVGLHERRARFETDVLAPLAEAGVDRTGLQLAFDFTTSTEANTTTRLFAVRDRMLEAIGEDGPDIVVDEVETGDFGAWVHATVQVPSFLHPADDSGVRRLRTDADGAPVIEGEESVTIDILIPPTLLADGGEAPILQYGHGLFGSRTEARKGWLTDLAERKGFMVVAADMTGMSEPDVGIWGVVLTSDVSQFPALAEKPLQGLCNHVAIARAVKRFTHDAVAADPTRVYYYGNSQGGTLGAILMALHKDVQRGVLGVPGGAYALLLNRSAGFSEFSGILKIPFPDPLDLSAMFGLLQTGIDQLDPLSYVQDIAPRQVLLQVAKEDAWVENQVSFLLGRSIGAPLLTPTPRPVWGFEEKPYPLKGSGVTDFDFGKPDNPNPTAPPPTEHDTHEDLRRLDVAQDQLWHFLETGEIASFCEGPCDPR